MNNKTLNIIKVIPMHAWFLLVGLVVGLIFTFLSIYVWDFDITSYKIKWPLIGNKNKIIFMILPWIILLIIFLFRRQFKNAPQQAKDFMMITLGLFALFWELNYELSSIHGGAKPFRQFIWGFYYCRMNMFVVGTFLILRKTEMLKWVAATSLFSGYIVIFGGYHGEAQIHSLVTHSIVLASFPSIAIAMSGSNYKIKNLMHSHLFNWTLVAVMLIVNYDVNNGWVEDPTKYGFPSSAGELTKDKLANNLLVGWAQWPGNIIIWIFLVMSLEWIYFGIHRLIIWRTYQRNMTLRQTYSEEFKVDVPQWFGFKLWGKNNWPQRYLDNLKTRWTIQQY